MKKAFLIILDGWGHGQVPNSSAIHLAHTPFMDGLYREYANIELVTYGEAVGLPEGQMGNSEVGHLNIGAGRVVYQELARIHKAIRDKELHQDPVLKRAMERAKSEGGAIHLMGLVSDGGVHAHVDHLKALCDILVSHNCPKVYIHAFMDGRDTDPKSGLGFIEDVLSHIEGTSVQLSTIIGRYYAMDRDKRWERVKKAYDLLVHHTGSAVNDWIGSLKQYYENGITDEFMEPMYDPKTPAIEEGDTIVCFNFRTDRPREILETLTQQAFPEYNMAPLDVRCVTFTRYDERFKNIDVIFEKEDLTNTLGEVISQAGKSQIRIAETEKYPHVTFFFNGGREQPFDHERRILIPSPKVATYDLQPEMSAPGIKEAILEAMGQQTTDFICLNFANPDMVGHTGSIEAAIQAVECVDGCLAEIVPAALAHEYTLLIIADHGNADYMINEDGSPNTAHTTNPVPFILVDKDHSPIAVSQGKLGDLAPTILKIMGIPKPEEMTGTEMV
jgi:2,3-bisphosphoglycerate-independent phosphoglycerate mutase